uniref:Uncharacterized protein n=1 Tax=Pyxicephalus adspersus TaxID=30357 RepID=A0AAV3ABU7_PYXAD|nr:TPA: hypothetical protein GDO54_015209 [Pyxicephalus adspersus]
MAVVENEQASLVPSMTYHIDIGCFMGAWKYRTKGAGSKQISITDLLSALYDHEGHQANTVSKGADSKLNSITDVDFLALSVLQ